MVRPPSFFPRRVLAESAGGGATLRRRGFTLVETVLALGIAMLFLAGIFSLLSVGLTTTKDASDDTVIGLILRETSNRVRGTPLFPAPNQPQLYFFDNRGRFVDQVTDNTAKNDFLAVATVSTPDAVPSNANLLAVVVKVYHLPQPGQTTIPTTAPKATFSLLKTSTSGKGWKQLDPSYQPKIDL